MTKKNSLIILALLFSLLSCDEKRIFDQYKTTGAVWHKDSIVEFSFNQKDTLNKHNLFVNIRNNQDYPYNNLFLIVKMQQPNKIIIVDTLEYKMADADGFLLGNGFLSTKESKLFYKENFKFNQTGSYTITIQQAVRQIGKIEGVTQLEGVSDIGFRIEKIN